MKEEIKRNRQIYKLRKVNKLSWNKIAKIYGFKSHNTVREIVQRWEEREKLQGVDNLQG